MAVNKLTGQNNAPTENTSNKTSSKTSNANSNDKSQNTSADVKSGANTPASVYKKSNEPYDKAEVERLLKESRDQSKMFEQLVGSVLNKQGTSFAKAWNSAASMGNLKSLFENLKVDDATRKKAQEMVSEDGYYGVKQTSERLLDFAKAYAGSDLSRIEEMKNSFLKGFKAAEKAWGGKLPDISYATYDAVMKGFDDMEKNASGTKETKSVTE